METIDDQAVEVSFEDALAEENSEPGTRPRPTQGQPQPVPEKEENELDIFAPQVAAKEWTFGSDVKKTYLQRELSVIGKAQWFSLIGNILDKALSGENAISLNSLITPPENISNVRGRTLAPSDFQDADTFVQAVGKLLVYAPEFMYKSVCIWLDVPDYEWNLVESLMRNSPSEGGMSDEMFEGIFATFIDQNYSAINRFFRERYPRLRGRLQARRNEHNQSASPKP